MITITKRQLAATIAEDTGQTKAAVQRTIQALFDRMTIELAAGNRFEFRDFGIFEPVSKNARRAHNPRTLERVDVPASRRVRFKMGRFMRAKLDATHAG